MKTPEVHHLRAQKKFPSLSTCKRWMRQYLTAGHIRPFKKTGGRIAEREIKGVVMFQLAFYRMVRPHARLYEVQAYLADRFPTIRPPSLHRKFTGLKKDWDWQERLLPRHPKRRTPQLIWLSERCIGRDYILLVLQGNKHLT